MRSRKIRPRWLMLGGLISIGCGIVVTELCGQHPVHDRAPAPCILNYPCLPRRDTWGYYPPKWRRWPEMPVGAVPTPEGPQIDLPEVDFPDPEVEEQRAPAPAVRSVPLQAEPTPEAESPAPVAPVVPGGEGVRPFQPTPAAEPPGGEADFPGPLRSAPVPSTPFPGAEVPNGAATPQPAPVPMPLNPFDGAEADAMRFQDDPPPTLPPSLRSTLRARDAHRAAQRERGGDALATLLTRLPQTASVTDPADRYAVQQTSATVWAAGTNDIRPADPNAGRIEQAIHHEPVE